MEKISGKKRFSIIARIRSANHAFHGFVVLLKTGHNFWTIIFFALLDVYLGFILNISSVEWIFTVIAVSIVFIAEAFNTAIEIDIDLTSPNYHPYARDTKDVSAGAVLISAVMAVIVGMIIFLPKIIALTLQ